jgi:chromosome segregation ATPase
MHARIIGCALLFATLLLVCSGLRAAQEKKDYLSATEADKIRDAETPSQRIKLFLSFAADRIKKFQYELGRPAGEQRRRPEQLNGLLNAYTGCLDDAAELIDLAIDKQQDVRQGIKEMQAKGKEFLTYLEELSKNGPELDSYKSNLDDAIEATRDALKDAEKAAKEIAPPPVRRKP